MMSKRIVAKDLGSELMLYDPEEDAVHVLNAAASLVYKLLHDGRKPGEIEREMRQAFAVDPDEEVLDGIHQCIAELLEKGLASPEKDAGRG
jgi:hypothetical protein